MNVVVFDVGGSHAGAALVQDASMELRGASSTLIDSEGCCEGIVDAFAGLARKVLGNCGFGESQVGALSRDAQSF